MKQYCEIMKVVLNSILIPSSGGVSPENFEKLNIKIVYSGWQHTTVCVHYGRVLISAILSIFFQRFSLKFKY